MTTARSRVFVLITLFCRVASDTFSMVVVEGKESKTKLLVDLDHFFQSIFAVNCCLEWFFIMNTKQYSFPRLKDVLLSVKNHRKLTFSVPAQNFLHGHQILACKLDIRFARAYLT